jgi:hypothetical protein
MKGADIDMIDGAYTQADKASAHSAQFAQSAHCSPDPRDEQSEQKKSSIIWAKDLPDVPTEQDVSIWGPFIVCGCVSLWSGVAGIGKSTIAWALAVATGRDAEFCGLPFSDSNLKVLIVDLETPVGLRKPKFENIATGNGGGNVAFWDTEVPLTVATLQREIAENGFDVVIVDTLCLAFPVVNEDDNAEATAQIRPIKAIADATNAAIVLIHHLGKADVATGTYKARGASARPAACDIVVNIEAHESQVDVITLVLAKSRYVADASLHVRKVGEDEFEVVEGLDERCASRVAKACAVVEQIIRSGPPKGIRLKNVLEDIAGRTFSEATTRRALDDLLSRGRIKRPERGVYAHPDNLRRVRSAQSAQAQGTPPDEQSEQTEHSEQSLVSASAEYVIERDPDLGGDAIWVSDVRSLDALPAEVLNRDIPIFVEAERGRISSLSTAERGRLYAQRKTAQRNSSEVPA